MTAVWQQKFTIHKKCHSKLENCRVQILCVPVTRTGITKHIAKRSFEPSCYHRGLIVGARTSLLKQKAGVADELQVCNRYDGNEPGSSSGKH